MPARRTRSRRHSGGKRRIYVRSYCRRRPQRGWQKAARKALEWGF